MAISDTQKVDLLWKKIGFSKTKTDTNAAKKAPNEAIVSELIIKPSTIWTDAGSIPSTQPAANTGPLIIYTETEMDFDLQKKKINRPSRLRWPAVYQIEVTEDDETPQKPRKSKPGSTSLNA